MAGACTVQAKAEHDHIITVDQVAVQQASPFAEAASFTLQSSASLLSAVNCCDQGYDIKSAVEAPCCDQGYQVSSMTGTAKALLAVVFSAFLALLARRYQQRHTHTLQFRQ